MKNFNEKSKSLLSTRKDELRTLQNGIEPKEKQVQTLQAEIAGLEEEKTSFEKEKGTELTSILSAAEQQEVNDIDKSLRESVKRGKMLFETRRSLEVKKKSLQSLLQDNLSRRHDEIQSNMQVRKNGFHFFLLFIFSTCNVSLQFESKNVQNGFSKMILAAFLMIKNTRLFPINQSIDQSINQSSVAMVQVLNFFFKVYLAWLQQNISDSGFICSRTTNVLVLESSVYGFPGKPSRSDLAILNVYSLNF